VVALVVFFPTFWATPLQAQISPGKLSRVHESLEGSSKCVQCHSAKDEEIDQRCKTCHVEISVLEAQDKGFHARNETKQCAECHPEHAGRDFDLVYWGDGVTPRDFDHVQAGWILEGKHDTLECRACHQPKFQSARMKELLDRTHPEKSWLGLDPACLGCHEDAHESALGLNCTNCHSFEAWAPAPGFDHAKSDFPLTGRHRKVECAKCHAAERLKPKRKPDGRLIPVYKPVSHDECVDCHTDPHQNRFGLKCASCHTTDDFHRVEKGRFDHDRTRYPLRGRHAALECASCHDPKTGFGEKPAFGACGDCHRDPHAGQATLAGAAVDCAACHTVQAFSPSTFTVKAHEKTPFPLHGRHAKTDCASCHTKAPKNETQFGSARVRLRPRAETCEDCHGAAHGNQLAGTPAWKKCTACHSVEGFKPSLFDADAHENLGYPLDGKHREIACAACHGPKRPGLPPLPPREVLGKAGVWLALGKTECVSCHVDPHGGRYPGERGEGFRCLDCHSPRGFTPSIVGAAEHDRFGFPLVGAHLAVPCSDCHQELIRKPSRSSLVASRGHRTSLPFDRTGRVCSTCHESPHGDQFAGRPGGDRCDTCHGAEAFVPAARFDHDRDTTFALKGAHERVPCASCHPRSGEPARVVYRPLDGSCRSCHRDDPGIGTGEGRPQ